MKSELIYPFDSEAFVETWVLWLAYRKEIKAPLRGTISEQAQLKKVSRLASGSEEVAVAIITQSIENGWRGLFTLKTPLRNDKRQSASEAHARFWS